MMWNWLVSVLAVGATAVLYDGSPLIPHANIMWDLVDQLGYCYISWSNDNFNLIEYIQSSIFFSHLH